MRKVMSSVNFLNSRATTAEFRKPVVQDIWKPAEHEAGQRCIVTWKAGCRGYRLWNDHSNWIILMILHCIIPRKSCWSIFCYRTLKNYYYTQEGMGWNCWNSFAVIRWSQTFTEKHLSISFALDFSGTVALYLILPNSLMMLVASFAC